MISTAPPRRPPWVPRSNRGGAYAVSVEAVLRLFETHRGDRLDCVSSAIDDRSCVVLGSKRGQHEVGDVAGIATPGTTNTNTQAKEVGTGEPARDRAEAVVPGETTAEAGLDAAAFEVDLVVDDEQALERSLEERDGRLNGAAGVVHVRIRLEERETSFGYANLGKMATELTLERPIVATREFIDDHEADVVAVALVAPTRVPEPDDEQVERRGGLAPTEEWQGLLLVWCGGIHLSGGLCRSLGGERLFCGLFGLGKAARAGAVGDHGLGGVVEERHSGDRCHVL